MLIHQVWFTALYTQHLLDSQSFEFEICILQALNMPLIRCTNVFYKGCYPVTLAQLRWTGHVIRMPDKRLPKKVFCGELQEGNRSQGDQKKRYKDTLKASLKDFDIPIGSLEQTAQERSKWRGLINKGAALYERKRIC